MSLKKISKFIVGVFCGAILTISIYSFAVDDNERTIINSPNVEEAKIPVDEINNFAKVYSITKNYYVESVTDTKLIKGAINGMLTNLDPHSTYLDKDEYKQLTEMTSGAFAGLGIEVSRDKDSAGVKVVAPIDGTPAYYAGIKSGDLIIKIDNQPVSSMSLDQAVKKMRGPAGTKVILIVARKNELKPLTFKITRALIEIKSVKYTMLTPDYAYVRITNFQSDTTNSLLKALDNIYNRNNHLKGIVLDLRDDPGGLLQSAVGVASTFLPQHSLIVSIGGRASNKQDFLAEPKYYNLIESSTDILNNVPMIYKQMPMVVLINQGTASASEIVAGSLQDYGRAQIVGTKSFGKGSVQTVIPLTSDTAIKLTTALYYTPKGRSIQAEGIRPDIIVQSEYSDLYDSWDLSEATLDNHLNNPLNNEESKNKNIPIITPPKQISTQFELKAKMNERLRKSPKVVSKDMANVDLKTDFQLQWALNILQGKPIPQQKIKLN